MAPRTVQIPPKPAALMGSLRGLGYSPETAIADLIDNSITAGASVVDIDLQWNGGLPTAAILDNGSGMNEDRLVDALCLGGEGPESDRDCNDLGRFGMGMKTASLSQAHRFTVLTKTASVDAHALTLDVAVIAREGWIAIVPEAPPDHDFAEKLRKLGQGTLILWEGIDELSGLMGLSKEAFYLRLEEVRSHLGMIFHRYIDGDASSLVINLNGRAVKAWDPFQKHHPATQERGVARIRHRSSSFLVRSYVLPHRDRFENDLEYDAAGGPGGWGARQGFYVYRGKRLLVAGSWLGLGGSRTWTRDETSRLARIQIDLPTDLDRDWRIDVRKSQARPPGALRIRLTQIAALCREDARQVFAFRGYGPRNRGVRHEASAIWLGSPSAKGIQYRINRDHPAIVACRSIAGEVRALNAVLSIIERSVPVQRIWLDVSETEGMDVPALDANDIEQLSSQFIELARALPVGLSKEERVDTLLLSLPGDLVALRAELIRKLGGIDG